MLHAVTSALEVFATWALIGAVTLVGWIVTPSPWCWPVALTVAAMASVGASAAWHQLSVVPSKAKAATR